MPTSDPTKACPALHILEGTMGRDREGRQLHPEHHRSGDHRDTCSGVCHCGEAARR